VRPLAHLVARAPVRLRSKLLAGFGVIVLLLIAVGVLGLEVLGESTRRTRALERLQRKTTAYRGLQNDNLLLRQAVAAEGGSDIEILHGGAPTASTPPSSENAAATLSRLRDSYDFRRLGFVPTDDERSRLREIEATYGQLVSMIGEATALDASGRAAEAQRLVLHKALPMVERLETIIDGLANAAEADIVALVKANRDAFGRSQRIVLATAAGGIVLALLLGFGLASSLIGPVQRMDERMAEIAAGDFSGHVEVANRDELGRLAGNLNRMNDELGRLYEVVRSQAAALADWNRTLEARVDEQAEELRASRTRIVAAADAERRRIERNLHDGAQQHLVALAMNLNLARRELTDDPEGAAALLEQLSGDVRTAIDELRNLAHGIYPPLLLDSGLPAALSAAAARSPLPVTVQTERVGRQPAEVEATVYFCCLEALQNAAKHTDGAEVTVRVWEEPGALRFEVADDGPGFDPDLVNHGQGLINMGDRLAALGGAASWESSPGAGTRVCGSVPVNGAENGYSDP
jgi:signal transduction histidine kinase